MEGSSRPGGISDDSAMTDGITYRHLAAHRIETILCRKDQHGWRACPPDAVAILHVQVRALWLPINLRLSLIRS